MIWVMAVSVALVGLGWALAWWDVRRRQSESLRASELAALHVKLEASDNAWRAADETTTEVLRSLAKEFSSIKLAIGMSPGTRMRNVRERMAEVAEKG